MNATQVIPPMTHPYGKYWKQPPLSEISVDDERAAMTHETFMALPEYSATNPSGVYDGKMWRCNASVVSRAPLPDWKLCWFAPGKTPDSCRIEVRDILIVEDAGFDKWEVSLQPGERGRMSRRNEAANFHCAAQPFPPKSDII